MQHLTPHRHTHFATGKVNYRKHFSAYINSDKKSFPQIQKDQGCVLFCFFFSFFKTRQGNPHLSLLRSFFSFYKEAPSLKDSRKKVTVASSPHRLRRSAAAEESQAVRVRRRKEPQRSGPSPSPGGVQVKLSSSSASKSLTSQGACLGLSSRRLCTRAR